MLSLSLRCVAPLLPILLCGPLAAQDAARQPNLLFVIADDLSPFDLPIYEPDVVVDTPAIDSLAGEGMVLDAAYQMGSWSGAVCTPSRHMVMSGRTVWHLPKRGIKGEDANPHCPADLPTYTLGAWFGSHGYATARTCKKGNSYQAANELFQVVHDKTCRGADDDTSSVWHADRVLEYLAAREAGADGSDKPFLIYLGFSHPHDPRHGTAELLAKYGADDTGAPSTTPENAPPLPVNYLPAHPFPHGHPGLRDEVNVQGVKRRRDPATVRNERGRQFACIEHMDRQIGRVLAKLRETGDLENTYVVFTSDHGMSVGRHGLMGKQNLYEHTWRVPMVVRGPGIAAGSRAPGNVYLLDCLATLCELAGIEAPATSEGLSFVPVLRGAQQTVRDVLFGVYCGGSKPGMRAVRKGDWKLIEYDVLDGAVRRTQLFDLGSNPYELLLAHHVDVTEALIGNDPQPLQQDLAGDPRFAERRRELEELLRAEMVRLDDPYELSPGR